MTSHGWITTTMVMLPLIAAVVIWVVPMPRVWVAPAALLVSLFEVGFWIEALVRYDFDRGGLQEWNHATWLKDLGVSYSVGFYQGFSVWLVGLTTVVMAASIAYGAWMGRDRPRAYYGLMLFLTGAIVGVFTAQDLLLFYVFWEAMLIPLYVLIGAWGGPGRLNATIKFVIYTMVGSLLMLAAVIVYGLQAGTFSMIAGGTNASDWIFLGFAAAFVVKAPLFPFHGWLPDAYRESPAEVSAVLSGVISKAAAFGFLRICFSLFPAGVQDFRTPILVLAAIGLIYGSLLAFRAPDIRGVVAYSSLAQLGLIMLGLFATNSLGINGAVLQMVNHGLISAVLFMLAGAVERRAATGRFESLGGMAKGRPALATVLMATGVITLAVPGFDGVRRRVRHPGRGLPAGLALRGRRRGRDRARSDVRAADDLRRAPRPERPGGARRGPRPATGGTGDPRSADRDPAVPVRLACGNHRARHHRTADFDDRCSG